jgi:hypothetical protein
MYPCNSKRISSPGTRVKHSNLKLPYGKDVTSRSVHQLIGERPTGAHLTPPDAKLKSWDGVGVWCGLCGSTFQPHRGQLRPRFEDIDKGSSKFACRDFPNSSSTSFTMSRQYPDPRYQPADSPYQPSPNPPRQSEQSIQHYSVGQDGYSAHQNQHGTPSPGSESLIDSLFLLQLTRRLITKKAGNSLSQHTQVVAIRLTRKVMLLFQSRMRNRALANAVPPDTKQHMRRSRHWLSRH